MATLAADVYALTLAVFKVLHPEAKVLAFAWIPRPGMPRYVLWVIRAPMRWSAR